MLKVEQITSTRTSLSLAPVRGTDSELHKTEASLLLGVQEVHFFKKLLTHMVELFNTYCLRVYSYP